MSLLDQNDSGERDVSLKVPAQSIPPKVENSLHTTCEDSAERSAIHVKIDESFSACKYPELRKIRILHSPSKVTLKGSVSCYFMKQMAQEILRKTAPQLLVENRLQVRE
jgi:hypothetical protein